MPLINVPLLKKTLKFIVENPKSWNQASWQSQCGTTCCFAGHAALLDGAEIKARPTDVDYSTRVITGRLEAAAAAAPGAAYYVRSALTKEEIAAVAQARANATCNTVQTPTGRYTEIRAYAKKALGLTEKQACDLFAEDNTLDDLKEKVAALVKAGKAQAEAILNGQP